MYFHKEMMIGGRLEVREEFSIDFLCFFHFFQKWPKMAKTVTELSIKVRQNVKTFEAAQCYDIMSELKVPPGQAYAHLPSSLAVACGVARVRPTGPPKSEQLFHLEIDLAGGRSGQY